MDHLSTPKNLKFHRNNWIAERAGWGFLGVTVLAALLGLFGHGAFSNAEGATADGSLKAAYPRFLRAASPVELDVTVAPALAADGRLAIWLDPRYLARFEIVQVEPEPEGTELGSDRTTFYFATSATVPVTVTFRLEARRFGLASGALGTGAAQLELRQFVYP